MVLFLLTILVLYSSLHLYIFVKIKNAFPFGTLAGFLLALVMALMISSPVLVRVSERQGFEVLPRVVAYVGYTWMGLVFLFFSFSLPVDVYRIFMSVGRLVFQTNPTHMALSPRAAFGIPLLVALVIASYGYFEARDIRNDTVVIRSPKIPKGVGTLTIAQISDVHLGLTVRHDRLKRILKKVEGADPDIVVSTGDLVDGQVGNLKGLSELLRAVHPKYGKFAITGNHDFYAGLDQALDFTESVGFTVLRGESQTVGGIINIAGVDDPTGEYFGLTGRVSERDLLSGLPRDKFTLLLKHRPVVDKEALDLFDLQLSGHTHNGQIFPFTLITRIFFPHRTGLIKLPKDSFLYTSRGSGTWGPPIRFMSPPEVTVVKVVHQEGP